MGFFKRLFDSASDSIKKSVEERKQELLKSVEERKQEFLQNVEDRKNEALAKIGLKSENSDNSHKSESSKPSKSNMPEKRTILSDKNIIEEKIYNADGSDGSQEIVTIPEGYTEIKGRFRYNLKEIRLPSTLKTIGEQAFSDYGSQLEKIDFSNCASLQTIGEQAFASCQKLEKIDLSNCASLQTIGEKAFYNCKKIEKLDFSNCTSLKTIGEEAFSECEQLKEIDFSNCASLQTIGVLAFYNYGQLEKIDFSNCASLQTIGKQAFSNCKQLEKIDFSNCTSLKTIGELAFENCNLTGNLNFSEFKSLERVRSNAFGGNKLSLLDFSGCVKLNLNCDPGGYDKLIMPSGQKEYNYLSLECYHANIDSSNCKNFKYIRGDAFPGSSKPQGEFIIPDSIEVIEGPFYRCNNLKTIVMPASLKEIKGSLGCEMEQLKKIDFSKVKNLRTIPKVFVSYGCHKLKELVIPQGVVEIEDDAFVRLGNLKRLFLPPTLESIGDLEHKRLSIYCFSPLLEELEPIVYGWDDDDDDDDDRDEEDLEELEDKKKMKINLFVLPQYLDKYIAQRNAERIPEDVLVIDVIPEEYRYYYDN